MTAPCNENNAEGCHESSKRPPKTDDGNNHSTADGVPCSGKKNSMLDASSKDDRIKDSTDESKKPGGCGVDGNGNLEVLSKEASEEAITFVNDTHSAASGEERITKTPCSISREISASQQECEEESAQIYKNRTPRRSVEFFGRRGEKKVNLSSKRLLLLLGFVITFPIFPLAISAGLGGLLAAVEGASFQDGFLYVASNLLNFGTPLTDYNPSNVGGVIIDVYVSVLGLLTFGIVLNVVNVLQIPLYVDQQIERIVSGKLIVPIIALCIVIPIYISFIGIVFGSFLGWVEGWAIVDGILYALSSLLALATPLNEVTPESMGGDILDIIISSTALGAAAVIVDYVTVLNPARYVRKRMKEVMDRFQESFLGEDSGQACDDHHPLSYPPVEDEEANNDSNHRQYHSSNEQNRWSRSEIAESSEMASR